MFLNESCAHFRSAYRSEFLSYSFSMLNSNEAELPQLSTCTEWSMTRSTGVMEFTFDGSFPALAIASRMAARSTIRGTPV